MGYEARLAVGLYMQNIGDATWRMLTKKVSYTAINKNL